MRATQFSLIETGWLHKSERRNRSEATLPAEMALMTMIARVVDGLPLVGTMQEDEQVSLINHLVRITHCVRSRCRWYTIENNHLLCAFCSQGRVCWSIKIRPNCCSANWVYIRRRDVPLKLAPIYSSEYFLSIRHTRTHTMWIVTLWVQIQICIRHDDENAFPHNQPKIIVCMMLPFVWFQLFNRERSMLFGYVW